MPSCSPCIIGRCRAAAAPTGSICGTASAGSVRGGATRSGSSSTTRRESGMTSDLFEDERRDLVLADRAVLLAGFALPVEAALIDALDRVAARAPFRHMITPGGFQIGRASCRERVCQYV